MTPRDATAKSDAQDDGLDYPFPEPPAFGDPVEILPGLHWLRMPLPFSLDHINLWLIEDGDGWTLIDTGLATDPVKALWRELFAGRLAGRPVERILVTHFHPDHVGLAGWLAEHYGGELWMTRGEWLTHRLLWLDRGESFVRQHVEFYRHNGLPEDWLADLEARGNGYAPWVSEAPRSFRRLADGDEFAMGGDDWRVIVGTGHAPEQACLYCPARDVLIAGDQILPRITPNISVPPPEPEANPLGQYLGSLDLFRALPASTLVLPSHGRPFKGLATRIDQIHHHHEERLDVVIGACDDWRTAADLLPVLFKRRMDSHETAFAAGEALAHMTYLYRAGRLERRRDGDDIVRFRRPKG